MANKFNRHNKSGFSYLKRLRVREAAIKAVGALIFLLLAFLLIHKAKDWQTLFVLFIFFMLVVVLVIVQKRHTEKLFISMMYLLVAGTFLNQLLLNLSFSFFNLFLYRLMLLLSIGVFFLMLLTKKKILSQYWEEIQVKGVLLFLGYWLAYAMVSLLWVKSFVDGVKYLFLLVLGISFVYLSVVAFNKLIRLYWFYAIWLVMTVVLLLIGLINNVMHVQLPTSTLYGASAGKLGYPTTVFFNQNDFATFLTISTSFYFVAVKNVKKVSLKVITLLLGCLAVYEIYLTESRASLLGVMVGLGVYAFLFFSARLKKWSLIGGACFIVLFILAFWGKLTHYIQLKLALATHPPIGAVMSSNSVRINLLRDTLHYFINSYGFGVGAGNLPFYFAHDPVYATNGVVEAHNWIAEITGDFGLFIGLGYLLLFVYLFYSLYILFSQKPKHRVLLEAGMIGLVSFLVSSISPSSVSNLYFHWVFLGFTASVVSVFKKRYPQLVVNKGEE
ncbi:O-antigen ligase family protein [Pullulanibacillus sp. KACC 23026]|uniref:teichuronic acid biosynthesis protein TuaE n=1 Tax=Pullulanibacillus sp. KACC 23026 TaxID=3028315 RepID=UPI0023AFF69D|nr:O-antigen ligase family protein [Pullulanibacillus sp. KACC 23026]WEG12631.1 O-antigen ligase family protein [Pullulanibacillus sp. KACC 23026]